MSYNFVKLKKFPKNVCIFILLMQIALKAKKMWPFLHISAAGSHTDRSGFAAVKYIHFHTVAATSLPFGNYYCLCQNKTSRAAAGFIHRSNFCPSKHCSAPAHLHQPEADLNDLSPMKVGVFFLPPWHFFKCYFVFLKRYPNTINALLSISGIHHERK